MRQFLSTLIILFCMMLLMINSFCEGMRFSAPMPMPMEVLMITAICIYVIHNGYLNTVEIEAKRIKCDQAIKRVLANMSILARTVKGTVTEVRNMSIAEIEASIDHESIEISSVRVNPGLSNSKSVLLNCQDSIKDERTVFYDIRFITATISSISIMPMIC